MFQKANMNKITLANFPNYTPVALWGAPAQGVVEKLWALERGGDFFYIFIYNINCYYKRWRTMYE